LHRYVIAPLSLFFTAEEFFMMAGTRKDIKYIPVHLICGSMSGEERENILALHAVTGCDITSFLAGKSNLLV